MTQGLIQSPPDIGGEILNYVNGVMTSDTGIVSLLSLDNVLPPEPIVLAAA